MRNARDPRRTRSSIQLLVETLPDKDANGDYIGLPTEEITWEGSANIQPWLPRYNIPAAPEIGGVQERRVAARVYLPYEAPVNIPGTRVRDVGQGITYTLITKGLAQAGGQTTWRCDLGAPRVSRYGGEDGLEG
ncbi:MAG: hypothetical protein LC687_02595 [Actinobacteria bacterium]|nr:hypothetical protein [Actinomycetota bacterium]MCA1806741.1 hypothetical protein [Actinomycetota bacterium]